MSIYEDILREAEIECTEMGMRRNRNIRVVMHHLIGAIEGTHLQILRDTKRELRDFYENS